MQATITSLVRTYVPYVIGWLVTWLTNLGVKVDESDAAFMTALLTFAIGSVYYLLVRLLESKWKWVGYLLGVPTKPTYKK